MLNGFNGIDVSFYQGDIDFKLVAAEGISFATAQLTFGSEEYMKRNEQRRIDWANKVIPNLYNSDILLTGGYHWLLPGDIEAQVDYFVRRMNELFGGLYGRICQLDVERNKRIGAEPSYDDALLFAKIFEEKSEGAQLALYYPRWYWIETGRKDLTVFPNTTLWQADYTDNLVENKFIAYGGLQSKIVQYTDQGIVKGIKTNCDENAFIGTKSGLWDALTGPGVYTSCTS